MLARGCSALGGPSTRLALLLALESFEHVVLERRWEVDFSLLESSERAAVLGIGLHLLAELVELERGCIIC